MESSTHEALLRVISHVCCQDWVNVANPVIRANHWFTFLPCFNERCKDETHRIVEELVALKGALSLWEALEFYSRQVA